jgi:hypothetical protein
MWVGFGDYDFRMLLVLAIFGLVLALTVGGFNIEAKRVRRLLSDAITKPMPREPRGSVLSD